MPDKYKYLISPLEHGLATEFPSIHIPGTWSPSMQNVMIEQHSLKKRWGYDTETRNVGSTKSVYVIAVYQISDGSRYTVYLTDSDLICKETASGKTWSYKTATYTTGTITDITGTTVTGSGTSWDTSGLAAGDKFIVDSDHTYDEEEDAHWAEIASITDATHLELTASYTGSGTGTYKARKVYTLPTNGRWAWAIVDDKFCFTNGNTNVQYWSGTGYAADLNASVAINARYCIEYANRLFIADYGTARDPYMVGWSKEGDPTDWTDNTAGSMALLETEDYITGLGKSGGSLLVYKRDNIHIYAQSGDAFSPVYSTPTDRIRGIGCIAPYSIVEVLGTDVFLGRDDFYIISGGQPQAIGRDSVRYDFFEQVSSTEVENVWGFLNPGATEVVWVADTSSGQRGYAWNYINKEWTIYSWYDTITGAGRGAI